MTDYELRFDGVRRLFGSEGAARLRRAHVCVVGIGGVGSWAVEALARSGVGALTLVDLDEICVSNVNRQLHAVDGEIGKSKVEVMARRVLAINPECAVHRVETFFMPANADEILKPRFDFVLDAMDAISKKCFLIAQCRERGMPVLTVGAAGGRRSATGVVVTDLLLSSHDRLLLNIRKTLRQEYNFPRGEVLFNVECVHSKETVVYPQKDGTVCERLEPDTERGLNCNSGYGTASFVTGTFGFVAAAHIVHKLTGTIVPAPE